MTLVVNLYAGPGTGKSTTAASVFAILKQNGINAELSHEFAKDLTWEKRHKTLTFQPYVIGKQMWRIQRLLGEVDIVINDSPVLLGLVYGVDASWMKKYEQFILEYHKSLNTLDIFLIRSSDRPYNPKGRNQTEAEASALDDKIANVLDRHSLPYKAVLMGKAAPKVIVSHILTHV